jgi:hypothetical protein
MSAQENATNVVTPVENVKVSEVLALLAEGKTRAEIAAHYGQSVALMARTVWKHPKLKGRKTIKQDSALINVVDDTEDEEPVADNSGNEMQEEPTENVQEELSPVNTSTSTWGA